MTFVWLLLASVGQTVGFFVGLVDGIAAVDDKGNVDSLEWPTTRLSCFVVLYPIGFYIGRFLAMPVRRKHD